MRTRAFTCIVGLIVLVLVLPTGPAVAQTAAGLDQYQLGRSVSGLIHSVNPSGQWFTVGRAGILWGAEFSLQAVAGTTEDLVVEVEDVSGGLPGVVLYSRTLAPADVGSLVGTLDLDHVSGTYIDLSGGMVQVNPGDEIGVRLSTAQPLGRGYQFDFMGSTDPYAGGEMLSGTGSNDDSDLAFKTFVAEPIFSDSFESGNDDAWL